MRPMPSVPSSALAGPSSDTSLLASLLALTANAMKGDDVRCFEAGADGYLAKPLRARELIEELRQLDRRTRD